ELAHLLQQPGAGGVGLGVDHPERLGAVGLEEHGVAALDVHVAAGEGADPDLLEDLPGLGQPPGNVGEEVLGRPALEEVAGPVGLLGAEGCEERLELAPAPPLVLDQRPHVGPHSVDGHSPLPYCYGPIAVALLLWPYCCGTPVGLMTLNMAPKGSTIPARRPWGLSNAGRKTLPPSSVALATVASTSETTKYTPRALHAPGLPDADEGAGRIGQYPHPPLVHHVHWLDDHGAPVGPDLLHDVVGGVHVDVGSPVRGARPSHLRADARHVPPALGG